jgi:tRNA(Phe) wybutosine-synthesizing methylase Tyw3
MRAGDPFVMAEFNMPTIKKQHQGYNVSFNVNSLITALVGALIMWGLKTSYEAAKENGTQLTTISTTLPFVQRDIVEIKASVGEVKNDVKNVQSTAVTRAELNDAQRGVIDKLEEFKERQKALEAKLASEAKEKRK